MMSSGYFAPPWETKYAVPVRPPGRTGVETLTVPTCDATGQFLGFSANVFSKHAFCSVFNGVGNCFGSDTLTRCTFAVLLNPPSSGKVIETCRLAPWVRDVFAEVETLNPGLNVKLRHDPTWNGLESSAVVPSVLMAVPEKDWGLQLVGLNMNSLRSITALIVRISTGTPSKTTGSGSVVIVNCEVCGSTSIFPRTTVVPRLNGPAITGTAITNPYGAPSYGPEI